MTVTVGKEWKINQAITGCVPLGGFGFGCGLSWTATALPNLAGQVGVLTSTQKSWMASLFAFGAILACPVTGLYVQNFNRKKFLLWFTAVEFLGWLLIGCATDSVYIYFGRILTGATTAGYTIIVPIYISEIASKENRGTIGSMFIVMLCLGKLFSNGVGISFLATTASFLCALHPILYALSILAIPESPKFLMGQGKLKNAYLSLQWLETTG